MQGANCNLSSKEVKDVFQSESICIVIDSGRIKGRWIKGEDGVIRPLSPRIIERQEPKLPFRKKQKLNFFENSVLSVSENPKVEKEEEVFSGNSQFILISSDSESAEEGEMVLKAKIPSFTTNTSPPVVLKILNEEDIKDLKERLKIAQEIAEKEYLDNRIKRSLYIDVIADRCVKNYLMTGIKSEKTAANFLREINVLISKKEFKNIQLLDNFFIKKDNFNRHVSKFKYPSKQNSLSLNMIVLKAIEKTMATRNINEGEKNPSLIPAAAVSESLQTYSFLREDIEQRETRELGAAAPNVWKEGSRITISENLEATDQFFSGKDIRILLDVFEEYSKWKEGPDEFLRENYSDIIKENNGYLIPDNFKKTLAYIQEVVQFCFDGQISIRNVREILKKCLDKLGRQQNKSNFQISTDVVTNAEISPVSKQELRTLLIAVIRYFDSRNISKNFLENRIPQNQLTSEDFADFLHLLADVFQYTPEGKISLNSVIECAKSYLGSNKKSTNEEAMRRKFYEQNNLESEGISFSLHFMPMIDHLEHIRELEKNRAEVT